MVAEGRTIKAIAATRRVPPEAVDGRGRRGVRQAGPGRVRGQRQARCSGSASCTRPSWTARSRARPCPGCCPSGLAEKLGRNGRHIGETERVVVTVLMSDIRAYSAIAEHADPSELAGQLNTHRAAMNQAILGEAGTVMQFVGDAVMAVFGAPFPQPDHADRAVAAALAMHERSARSTPVAGRRPAALRPRPRACRPARRPRPCSGPPSTWSTRWSATPSTCPSACSNWLTPERLCCLRLRSRRCAPRSRRSPSARNGSRDATLRYSPTRSTGWGDDEREPYARWPYAACARPSRPRTRRSARCAGSNLTVGARASSWP